MATIGDVLDAFAYYIDHGGYYEKKNGQLQYLTRAVDNFQANAGSANWTYMGRLCGVNPGAWCAMMVSTAVHDGCGFDVAAARKAMWGVWPYTTCNQLWEAADNDHRFWSYYQRWTLGKGDRVNYTPRVGDVIIFTDDLTTRTHTGMVYAVDSNTVYTYEGNSGNMARKRSYYLGSSYIYGYVTLNLDDAGSSRESGTAQFQRWLGVTADGIYGPVTKAAAVSAHQSYLNAAYGADLAVDGVWGPQTYYATMSLQRPDDSDDVKIWQGLMYCLGCDPVGLDGYFGPNTEDATIALQNTLGLNATGIADRYTWARALGYSRPVHGLLRYGSAGSEVRYLQWLLTNHGYPVSTDGVFGPLTERAVRQFQEANGLEADGVVGPLTWAALE